MPQDQAIIDIVLKNIATFVMMLTLVPLWITRDFMPEKAHTLILCLYCVSFVGLLVLSLVPRFPAITRVSYVAIIVCLWKANVLFYQYIMSNNGRIRHVHQ